MIELIDGYWIDKNNNKWNAKDFTKEEAEKACKSLKKCFNCIDCMNCQKCRNCRGCERCKNCKNCKNCRGCSDLQNSSNLWLIISHTETNYWADALAIFLTFLIFLTFACVAASLVG